MKSNIINKKIPSDINCICNVTSEIIDFWQKSYEINDEGTKFELKVVLNELILNAIKHGNKENQNKEVRIAAGITYNGRIFAIIEDQGEGYDYDCQIGNEQGQNGIIDVCNMKESGRGILIVVNLCDKVKFNSKGNKVIVMKDLSKCSC